MVLLSPKSESKAIEGFDQAEAVSHPDNLILGSEADGIMR